MNELHLPQDICLEVAFGGGPYHYKHHYHMQAMHLPQDIRPALANGKREGLAGGIRPTVKEGNEVPQQLDALPVCMTPIAVRNNLHHIGVQAHIREKQAHDLRQQREIEEVQGAKIDTIGQRPLWREEVAVVRTPVDQDRPRLIAEDVRDA